MADRIDEIRRDEKAGKGLTRQDVRHLLSELDKRDKVVEHTKSLKCPLRYGSTFVRKCVEGKRQACAVCEDIAALDAMGEG